MTVKKLRLGDDGDRRRAAALVFARNRFDVGILDDRSRGGGR
jgi:hypothetical protein